MAKSIQRPIRPTRATSDPELEIVVTDDGSRTLRFRNSSVTWHSESGALAESQLVFIDNSRLQEHLNAKHQVHVLEIGFGTGLNFWLTASSAIKRKTKLVYHAIEPDLIAEDVFVDLQHDQLTECQPALERFADTLFRERRGELNTDEVQFKLYSSVDELPNPRSYYDCIYHDPFSPETAPGLWSPHLFNELFLQLAPERNLVTYCVKSRIQKLLKDVGFQVTKSPGPRGGKREVLIARKPGKAIQS